MKELTSSWITDGTIDFEYKKYILLAYFQHVQKQFGHSKLYPSLSELVAHYNGLLNLKKNSSSIQKAMPKELNGIDAKRLELLYKDIDHAEELKTIFELVEYALPEFQSHIENGKDIYEFIESCLNLETVGLLPIYKNEGYVFLHAEDEKVIDLYRYHMSMIETSSEKFSALNVEYMGSERKSFSKTFENIKLSLARRFNDLPNPATYLVTSRYKFPLVESFLPVAKRMLMRELRLTPGV